MLRVVHCLSLQAMRCAWLARQIFRIDVLPLVAGDRYFDSATLALRHVLCRWTRPGRRVLEVGTGSSALLARWMAQEFAWEVAATEWDEAVAARAQASIEAFAPGSLDIIRGSFFADVPEPLDLVIFNPPFVPTSLGTARGLSEELRLQWDGGTDGTAVLREFLAAFAGRATRAEALVAVNVRHVSVALVEECLASQANLRLVEWFSPPWTPARVARIVRDVHDPGAGGHASPPEAI